MTTKRYWAQKSSATSGRHTKAAWRIGAARVDGGKFSSVAEPARRTPALTSMGTQNPMTVGCWAALSSPARRKHRSPTASELLPHMAAHDGSSSSANAVSSGLYASWLSAVNSGLWTVSMTVSAAGGPTLSASNAWNSLRHLVRQLAVSPHTRK